MTPNAMIAMASGGEMPWEENQCNIVLEHARSRAERKPPPFASILPYHSYRIETHRTPRGQP